MSKSPPVALSRPVLPFVIGTTAIHAVLWNLLLLYLGLVVPRLARTYRDFNVRPPDATRWTFTLSSWTVTYFYLVAAAFLLLLGLDAGPLFLLRRQSVRTWSALLWFGVVTLATLLVLAVMLLASLVPLFQLKEGLSK